VIAAEPPDHPASFGRDPDRIDRTGLVLTEKLPAELAYDWTQSVRRLVIQLVVPRHVGLTDLTQGGET